MEILKNPVNTSFTQLNWLDERSTSQLHCVNGE